MININVIPETTVKNIEEFVMDDLKSFELFFEACHFWARANAIINNEDGLCSDSEYAEAVDLHECYKATARALCRRVTNGTNLPYALVRVILIGFFQEKLS